MAGQKIRGGAWVTMVTPFLDDWSIDYSAVEKLVEWYITRGVAGIFAVCQSSEMFNLERGERRKLARFVVRQAAGRVPVAVSGHVSLSLPEQLRDLDDACTSGADTAVLITNRLAGPQESDDVFLRNLEVILKSADSAMPLGLYECPFPYKRLLSPALLSRCAQTGRFLFLKDTSCETGQLRAKIEAVKGSPLKLFNANAATLPDSLHAGAAGYSGVMANFHPELYAWLCAHHADRPELAAKVVDFLSLASVLETRAYPSCAKYYLSRFIGCDGRSRCLPEGALTASFMLEVDAMERMAAEYRSLCGIRPAD